MDEDLIEEIYDAALDQALWPDVLNRIASAAGAVSASLFLPGKGLADLVMSRDGAESQAAYVRHWWEHDIIADTVRAARGPGLFCDWLTMRPESRARHPFYQEFRRAFGLRDNVALLAEAAPGLFFCASLQLPSSAAAPPDATTVQRFGRLGRHVGRAILFAERAAPADPSSDFVDDLLATLSCGIACLGESGHVLATNRVLESFARDGLAIANRRLVTADRADQAALDGLVARALAPGGPSGPILVQVGRPSGRRALLVGALPISAGRSAWAMPGVRACRAVVTVTDPQADASVRAEPMLRSLNLSPAEARLAALVGCGSSLREAAEQLGITEGTARTRLKLVFDKLGLARQSELARLVTRVTLVGTG